MSVCTYVYTVHCYSVHTYIIIPLHVCVCLTTYGCNACIGSDQPKISELCKYVKVEVAPQWYDLGVQLLNEEQVKKLNVMQSDHPGDSEKCCTALFNHWLQVDTTASWDKLMMALIHIGKDVLADTIKKMTTESISIYELNCKYLQNLILIM